MEPSPSIVLAHLSPPTARVVALGEFDLATAPRLSSHLERALGSGCRHFSVHLGAVTFIDACTVRVLVGLHRRIVALEGSLAIVAASPCVRRVLGLLDLDALLDVPAPGALGRSRGSDSPPVRLA